MHALVYVIACLLATPESPQSALRGLGGLKPYTPASVGQYIAIRDNQPFHAWLGIRELDPSVNAKDRQNPNSKSPWRVSGGMEGLTGWQSVKLTNVDKTAVKVSREDIPIANAGRALPGFRWTFPDGAMFADILINHAGEPFEVRTRKKIAGKWRSAVSWTNPDAAPKGYAGAGKCSSCHDSAGSSQQYGILIKGNDTVFSYNPME